MRRFFSATVLLAAVVASVATSKLPTPTTTTSLRSPASDLDPAVATAFTIDALASQSPSGPWGGAAMVSAEVEADGAATVTATLSLLDGAGATKLATDTVALTGSGDLFLFDDVEAFAGCADGATCDQAFQVVFHTTGDATVTWTFEAELYDVDDAGRTGELSLHLR